MSAGSIAVALGGHKSGAQWMAKCPAHQDRNPSLALRDGNQGTVLLTCHAGCKASDVIAVLKDRGLWDRSDSRLGEIVAEYDYTDERGELLYQVVRYEPKNFRQRRPDGAGGWIWNSKSTRHVLYRLPEVLEAPIVFVVEGEKDVETLRENGFTATTNAGGAKSAWLRSYTDALAGREVIVIPDSDEPGQRRTLNVARALAGKVAALSVLELDGAKDISEWFADGRSSEELAEIVNRKLAVQ